MEKVVVKREMEEYDLVQCIDRALDRFGSCVKNSVFWRLLILHNSETSEVISDPVVFSVVIKEISPDNAAEIEMSIINEIGKTFDLSAEETRSLVTAINAAKERMIKIASAVAPSDWKSGRSTIEVNLKQRWWRASKICRMLSWEQ